MFFLKLIFHSHFLSSTLIQTFFAKCYILHYQKFLAPQKSNILIPFVILSLHFFKCNWAIFENTCFSNKNNKKSNNFSTNSFLQNNNLKKNRIIIIIWGFEFPYWHAIPSNFLIGNERHLRTHPFILNFALKATNKYPEERNDFLTSIVNWTRNCLFICFCVFVIENLWRKGVEKNLTKFFVKSANLCAVDTQEFGGFLNFYNWFAMSFVKWRAIFVETDDF